MIYISDFILRVIYNQDIEYRYLYMLKILETNVIYTSTVLAR